jgi:pimeloyl-ACP methyl ester carboxylesterase
MIAAMRSANPLAVLVPLVFLTACASAPKTKVPPGMTALGASVASADGNRIVYDAGGAGDVTIVFVHGWSCNRGHWDHQMQTFLHEHRVVAIDLGGHGDSGRSRVAWTFDAFARDIVAVANQVGAGRMILVGHSMGGMVSLRAAKLMPDRVIGVVGVDTLHNVDQPAAAAAEARRAYADALEENFQSTMTGFVQRAFPDDADPSLVQRVLADALATDPAVAIGIPRTARWNLENDLAGCPAPVRCINSTRLGETNLQGNRRHAPTFDAVIMQNVGHFPMLEAPDEFNRHLREVVAELAAGST